MPVHRVGFNANELCEYKVTQSADGGFAWQQQVLPDGRLRQQVEAIVAELGADTFCEGYVSEINLATRGWMHSLAAIIEQGMILLIDYGFPRHEYYHAERYQGTLMCHYRHRAHDDPLILPGLQDITAHVDFTAVAETAVASDLAVAGYTTQAHFLLAAGLPQLLEQAMGEELSQQITLNQQVKKLTLPHEMGELFKVIALTKGLDIPLLGFSMVDLRGRL
jgi:SAM-dependent MidA family methyltransferase